MVNMIIRESQPKHSWKIEAALFQWKIRLPFNLANRNNGFDKRVTIILPQRYQLNLYYFWFLAAFWRFGFPSLFFDLVFNYSLPPLKMNSISPPPSPTFSFHPDPKQTKATTNKYKWVAFHPLYFIILTINIPRRLKILVFLFVLSQPTTKKQHQPKKKIGLLSQPTTQKKIKQQKLTKKRQPPFFFASKKRCRPLEQAASKGVQPNLNFDSDRVTKLEVSPPSWWDFMVGRNAGLVDGKEVTGGGGWLNQPV